MTEKTEILFAEIRKMRDQAQYDVIPASSRMLYEAKEELKANTRMHVAEVEVKIQGIHSEINGLRSDMTGEINGLHGEINGLRSDMIGEIKKLTAAIEKMSQEVHNTRLLVEEQNSRNKFVFDGLISVQENLAQLQNTKKN